MNKEEIMNLFYRYCCWNNPTKVQQLCEQYPNDIDFMDNEGQAFGICFSYGYIDLLKVLLDFYIERNLQCDVDSKEYKIAYHNLQYMLEEALDRTEPSEEIHNIIDKYISDTKDTESEAMSSSTPSECRDDKYFVLEEHRESSISTDDGSFLILTAENLGKLGNHDSLIGSTTDLLRDVEV